MIKIRPNVMKHLPILTKQIADRGWADIRDCMIKGNTKFLSQKDRIQVIRFFDMKLGKPMKGDPNVEA